MNANVVTAQFQPGKIDEAIRIFRDSIVPSLKQLQGFKGAFLLTDLNSGKVIASTWWETEADLKAHLTGVFPEQIAKFAQVIAEPPTRESYEISVQV